MWNEKEVENIHRKSWCMRFCTDIDIYHWFVSEMVADQLQNLSTQNCGGRRMVQGTRAVEYNRVFRYNRVHWSFADKVRCTAKRMNGISISFINCIFELATLSHSLVRTISQFRSSKCVCVRAYVVVLHVLYYFRFFFSFRFDFQAFVVHRHRWRLTPNQWLGPKHSSHIDNQQPTTGAKCIIWSRFVLELHVQPSIHSVKNCKGTPLRSDGYALRSVPNGVQLHFGTVFRMERIVIIDHKYLIITSERNRTKMLQMDLRAIRSKSVLRAFASNTFVEKTRDDAWSSFLSWSQLGRTHDKRTNVRMEQIYNSNECNSNQIKNEMIETEFDWKCNNVFATCWNWSIKHQFVSA